VINAQISSPIGAARSQARLWRPGTATFWILVALESVILIAAALFLISRIPERTPLTAAAGAQQARDAVLIGGAGDPLIEVAPGVIDRASSVRGLRIDGQVYYYYYEGRPGYDPLSRGAVAPEQVELLLRDEMGSEVLVIYRLVGA
jgi:hypothetical protein